MYEQERNTQDDAIEIGDFVYAATGARVRRLTMPDGTHWFPMVDVCKQLGYTTPRKALTDHVSERHRDSLETVTGGHCLSIPAGREWRRDMQMINLQGLIMLVNACTKPECAPFKLWVAEVIEIIQREGSYALDEAAIQPTGAGAATAYAMPEQVVDALVRLEKRNIDSDEEFAASMAEKNGLLAEMLREYREGQKATVQALNRIADSMERLGDRVAGAPVAETVAQISPQELLAGWQARNLIVTEDVHSVAAYLAPALLRGGARYPLEEIARRTGLTHDRVHDCVRMLIKRGCMRQTGNAEGGAPVYVLP
ncbi:Bro-N domain-containing protein [Streptomyces sp. NPDC050738]|uniref:BRO-N domain-containing protein n=1 Tax=Streptomyces sp. NPDC050738 TaxID=3154744 RepID=UPI00342D493E